MRTLLLFVGTLLAMPTFGQSTNHEKLIELGKCYKDFMFRNEPTKEIFKDAKKGVPETLVPTLEFILQTITSKNKLLSPTFLTVPDDNTLKQIYIVRTINLNLRSEERMDNYRLIDSLNALAIPRHELIHNYYGMLFIAVGNKNQPFDFSKVNFKMKEYGLRDDTEKGIFYLMCMETCGSTIWGFMNIVKPPNTKKAYEHILKFPRFNGLPYFQYTDFFFDDFEMIIVKEQGLQSYKGYYMDKLYDTLLYHLFCLKQEGAPSKAWEDLLLGSILKEKSLYKYSKRKETLESLFTVLKE